MGRWRAAERLIGVAQPMGGQAFKARPSTLSGGTYGTAEQSAEKLAHACSTVEERPLQGRESRSESVTTLAAVATICRARRVTRNEKRMLFVCACSSH